MVLQKRSPKHSLFVKFIVTKLFSEYGITRGSAD